MHTTFLWGSTAADVHANPTAHACTRLYRTDTAPMHSDACMRPHRRLVCVYLQGGVVVNHDQQFRADVLIEDGLISVVDPNGQVRDSGSRWW
jgi:hypothetical protein